MSPDNQARADDAVAVAGPVAVAPADDGAAAANDTVATATPNGTEPATAAAADAVREPEVQGFIERMEPTRVSGWAWDRTAPGCALEIEIQVDGRAVGTTKADRFRQDLKDGRIGDGCHAFQVFLDEPLPIPEPHRISAWAHAGVDGTAVPLVDRKATQATSGQAGQAQASDVAAGLRRWLEKMAAEQDAFRSMVRGSLGDLRAATMASAKTSEALSEQISDVHAMQDSLSQQMAALEVFQTRLDALHASIEQQAATSGGAKRTDRGLKLVVALLAILSTASLLMGVWSMAT